MYGGFRYAFAGTEYRSWCATERVTRGVDVTGFDIHPAAVAITGLRWNVTLNDFLLVKPENTGLFERILMNPPFSDSRWIAHFQHAMRFLKPGGRLIAILPGAQRSIF